MEASKIVKLLQITSIAVSAAVLTACQHQTQSMYHWGGYQTMVYKMYRTPKDATPEKQIEVLQKEAQKATSQQRDLPPGFRAHLGFLFTQVGDSGAARIQFEEEKSHFPESAVFMDHLLGKMKKK
jgi:hypothetical protein